MNIQQLSAEEMKNINGGGGDDRLAFTEFGPGYTGDGPAQGGPAHGYDPLPPASAGKVNPDGSSSNTGGY